METPRWPAQEMNGMCGGTTHPRMTTAPTLILSAMASAVTTAVTGVAKTQRRNKSDDRSRRSGLGAQLEKGHRAKASTSRAQ